MSAGEVGYEKLLPPEIVRFNDTEFTIQRTFGKPSRALKGGGLDGTIVRTLGYVRRYNEEQDSLLITRRRKS